MYPGSLEEFYTRFSEYKKWSYNEHYNTLIEDSTEFAASYTRSFSKLGINARTVIANDSILQNKWRIQQGLRRTNTKKLLYKQIQNYQPDVLWIEDLRFLEKDDLNYIRENVKSIKLLVGYLCAPWSIDDLEKLQVFNLIITCTPGLKVQFEQAGIKSFLVYHGFDSDLLTRINSENKTYSDQIIFTGSLIQGKGYHKSRIQLIEHLLDQGIDLSLYINVETKVKITAKRIIRFFHSILSTLGINNPERYFHILQYGSVPVNKYPDSILKAIKKPKFGIEMLKLLKSAKIVLNSHGEIAGNYAGNMRLFEATGTGSCLLTDNKSNISDLFEVGKEIVVYEDREDCAGKISWLLENEEERKSIATAGKERTLRSHSILTRASKIIEILTTELRNSSQ